MASKVWAYIRAIGGAVLVATALCWLAWHIPALFTLDIGGAITLGAGDSPEAPVYDAPFLTDVHAPEPADELLTITTTNRYRWTFPHSQITIPNLNGGTMLVRLRLAPPPVPTTALTLTLNGEQVKSDLAPGPRTLHLFAPAAADGTLIIGLDAPLYQLPPDPRAFGVALSHITVQPSGWNLIVPWAALAALAGVLLLLGVGAVLAGLRPWVAGGAVLVVGVALAALLVGARSVITIDAGRLLIASFAGCGVIVVGRGLGAILRQPSAEQREIALIAGLTGLGLAVRLVGLRHPQANYSDLMLHVNNLTGVARGEIIFPEGLTCEAGAGRAPYPPGLYVVLAPLLALFSNHPLVMQWGGATLDALVIPLLWWSIRTVRNDAWGRRAALWAATLYLVPLAVLRSLSIGEYTNTAGQALALPGLLGAAVWVGLGMPRRWRAAVGAALALAALVHSGVLISLALWGATWFGLLVVQRRWRAAGQLALLGGGAVVLAAVLYFSAFIGDPTLASTNPECPVLQPVAAKFGNVIKEFFALDGRVPVWLWLIGVGGLIAGWRRIAALAQPLAAWQATMLSSQMSLLWSEQTVRWWLFVVPALCLGGGIGLATLAQRGRGWRWVAVALTVIVLALSLGLWIQFIVNYRTGNFVP